MKNAKMDTQKMDKENLTLLLAITESSSKNITELSTSVRELRRETSTLKAIVSDNAVAISSLISRVDNVEQCNARIAVIESRLSKIIGGVVILGFLVPIAATLIIKLA